MDNHITAVFAPDPIYTRHSEGAFVRLKDGGIYFAYSRFSQSDFDDAPSDIVACVSYDEGETWSEPQVVMSASFHHTKNIMSVSLLRMNNGDIGLFYLVKSSPTTSEYMLSRSADEGKTFYKHTLCSPITRRGYYVVNNDRVERLQSGRLIVPAAFHRGGHSSDKNIPVAFDGRGFICFWYSDDDGETWHESFEIVYAPFNHTKAGLQEPGIVELKNGCLWGYARTDQMYQYEFFSMYAGQRWTTVQPSRFTSPPSPMKIKRNPYTDELVAVWNPIPNYNGRELSRAGWGRTPFVYAISKTDGATWSEQKIIEDGADNGYCYPAIFFTQDGCMLCAYCSGGAEDKSCLARLSIQKIGL